MLFRVFWLNKKANGGVFILVIVVILFGIVEIIAHPEVFMPRECQGNEQCSAKQYCGSDFKCHESPVDKVVNNYNDFTSAGVAVAVAIILAAFILKINNRNTLFMHCPRNVANYLLK